MLQLFPIFTFVLINAVDPIKHSLPIETLPLIVVPGIIVLKSPRIRLCPRSHEVLTIQ